MNGIALSNLYYMGHDGIRRTLTTSRDYNAQNSEWLESKTRTNQPGIETLSLRTTQELTQLVKGPTLIKWNKLDLIMSEKPSICSRVSTEC